MGITCNEMKSKKQKIEKELEEIYRMEAQFPQGELRCSKNNSRYKWLFKDKKGTAYLPKKKSSMDIKPPKNTDKFSLIKVNIFSIIYTFDIN